MNQHPEGRIIIRLDRNADGDLAASLQSSRPLAAARWFEGKTVAETLRLLPVIFRVCGVAQASAAVTAVESARGLAVDSQQANAREALVLAETLREHLLRVLTGWIDLAEHPDLLPRASEVMRLPARLTEALYPQRDAFRPGGGRLEPDREAVDQWLSDVERLLNETVLGIEPRHWLSMDTPEAIDDWSANARGAGAWLIRDLGFKGWQSAGATRIGALPSLAPETLAARLDTEAGFVATPDWNAEIFETGAFARVGDHPLVRAARQAYGDGLLARSLSRLVETATIPGHIEALLSDGAENRADTETAPGLSQVEAARGRLVHRVKLEGDTVTFYRILAPTEWNFHPQGAVAQALANLPPSDDMRRLAGLLVEAIDPCVGYDLEVADDA